MLMGERSTKQKGRRNALRTQLLSFAFHGSKDVVVVVIRSLRRRTVYVAMFQPIKAKELGA